MGGALQKVILRLCQWLLSSLSLVRLGISIEAVSIIFYYAKGNEANRHYDAPLEVDHELIIQHLIPVPLGWGIPNNHLRLIHTIS